MNDDLEWRRMMREIQARHFARLLVSSALKLAIVCAIVAAFLLLAKG